MLARLFSSRSGLDITINLNAIENNEKYRLPYFAPNAFICVRGDDITGSITLASKSGRVVMHNGLTVSIIGQIRVKSDDGLNEFFRVSERVLADGSVTSSQRTEFTISTSTCPAPSFYGTSYDCRYIVTATCGSESATVPVYVLFVDPVPGPQVPHLSMEIGITNLLRVAFTLQSPTLDVASCLIGLVEFTEVRIRIVKMMFQVLRVEEYRDGLIGGRTQGVIAQYELVDGVPVRGQRIPVRIFFPGIKLWPFVSGGNTKLAVGYSLRFLMLDDDGKKYYKEITRNIVRLAK